jgi:hypothetical protein
MKIQEKLDKIKSIINSCETYEQVQTCFSFAKSNFFEDASARIIVLGWIESKTYELHDANINEYKGLVKQIIDPNI